MAISMNRGDADEFVVELRNIKKLYPVRQSLFRSRQQSQWLTAVNGVDLRLKKGESLGIAGESGCGKSTMGRLLLKLIDSTEGQYLFNGEDVTVLRSKEEILRFRRQAQLVFQNPFEALNPRFTVQRSITEPLTIHGIGSSKEERAELVKQALGKVNLQPAEAFLEKYPHQMSGGQLQRVVLARALVLKPAFLVADEPVSMLDVSVRAGVLNLMKEIAEEMQLATVYISHDLSLLQYLCDHTAIMYLGQIVEYGRTEDILTKPLHPYAQALVAAIPTLDPGKRPEEIPLSKHVPSPVDLPSGCLLQDRCPYAQATCKASEQILTDVGDGHLVRCGLVCANNDSLKLEGGKAV